MKKLTAALVVLAIVFLGLSVAQAKTSVSLTEEAIDGLQEIRFDAETREKLDTAIARFEGLDPNIHLEQKVENAAALEEAKREYVRLAIKTAVVMDQRRVADDISREDLIASVEAARNAVDTYCPAPACEEIPNYKDLAPLEKKYAPAASEAGGTADTPSDEGGGEAIEVC